MGTWIRFTALAIGCAAALSSCSKNKPSCKSCGPNQECVEDDVCGCRSGWFDCNAREADGCEFQGSQCPNCNPEPEPAACARAHKSCGTPEVVDRCGVKRTLDCGDCPEGMLCGYREEFVCGIEGCEPESDTAFCQRWFKDCGEYTAKDNCDTSRTVDCGTCPDGQTCGGAGIDNLCSGSCPPESNAQMCARYGKTCGTLVQYDNCGHARSVDCGRCAGNKVCTTDLVCVDPIVPENGNCITIDGQMLQCAAGLACLHNGLTGPDLQGACKRICQTNADCPSPTICAVGTIRGGGGVCGTPKGPGASGCTDLYKGASFCWDAAEPEGSLLTCVGGACLYVCDFTGNDQGPLPCPPGRNCSGVEVGNPEVAACVATGCSPESNTAICSRLGLQCGSVSTTDVCGVPRLVECGTCGGGQVCGARGFDNICGTGDCTPELDDAFCTRLSRNCGAVTASDNCGAVRTVDCGSCNGNVSCGATAPNVCGCADDDASFCLRQSATCGQVKANDTCGVERTVNCGACRIGESCDPSRHVCVTTIVPEEGSCLASNGTMLACATGLTCVDNGASGFQRQAVCKRVCQNTSDCGTGQVCAVGSYLTDYGVCGTPKGPGEPGCQDFYEGSSFCWSASTLPGMALLCLAGVCNYVCDYEGNTGDPLPCPAGSTCSPAKVPEPGYVPLATCERSSCTAETTTLLCARLGKNCGTVGAADACGKARVVDCGLCGSGQSCGATEANVCGTGACAAETDAAFCARLGKDCGSVAGKDNCGQSRSVNCGSCSGGLICGAGGTPNVCACSESQAALCGRLAASCGPLPDVVDQCGVTRTVNCGACSADKACDPEQHVCTADIVRENQSCLGASGDYLTCAAGLGCVYTTGGTPMASCKRICQGARDCPPGQTCSIGMLGSGAGVCGTLKAPGDTGCGNFWTSGSFCWEANEPQDSILDCFHNACTYICDYEGNTQTLSCPTGSTCSPVMVQTTGYVPVATCELASCAIESDPQFCSRFGKDCGSVGGPDTCGRVRTVSSCGSCKSGSSCGALEDNVCGVGGYCFPETSGETCLRLGKNCSSVTATDNCGTTKTVSCGSCTAPKVCGAVTPNVCQ